MAFYKINLDDKTAKFYKRIAKTVDRTTEEILSDTLLKCCEMLARESLKEDD